MACESKKISELTRVTTLNPGDLIPIIQDGENKAVTVQDLLCQKPKGNCCEDKKTLSEILLAANKALEMARVAWKMSNKAFNEVCSLKEKVNALDVAVSDLQQILCQFENFKNWVINHFDQLERSLAITIEKGTSINGQFTTYTFKQGGVAISPVVQQPRMAPSLNAIYNEWPVTVEQILQLKSDMSQRLYFRAGKFEQNGQYYNGLQEVDAIYIPTRINHLDDGENVITGINVGYNDNKPAQIVNNIATIPSFGGYTGNGIPVKLTGGKAYVDPSDVGDKLDLDDLGDVETPNPHDGDVLYYDGTKWINIPVATLIAQNLDCEAVKACFSTENFNVAPLVVTLEYNERVANFAVTSSGAWKIQKVTSGDNVFTASIQDDVHQNPGTNLPLVITANSDNTTGQDREVEWDVIPWITVPGLIETQRIKVIQKAQAAPPTPTVITVDPDSVDTTEGTPISVDLDADTTCDDKTLTIDSTNLVQGITATVTNNNTKIHVEIDATVPEGNYSFTVSDNCGSTPVVVPVIVNPVGTVLVTYVGSHVTGLPSGKKESATIGSNYTRTNIQPASGYEITNVTFQPTGGTFDDSTGTVSIPNIQTNVKVTITTQAITPTGTLTVNPTSITVPEGENTTDNTITISTTCSGGNITIGTTPAGISAVVNSGHLVITVQDTVVAGTYTFTVSDDCGNSETITVNVIGQTSNPQVTFVLETSDTSASVTVDGHTITVNNPYTDQTTSGTNYSQVITPASGYTIVQVDVTPNGSTYTWDSTTNTVDIPSISSDHQVHIYITANPFANFDSGNKGKFNAYGIIEQRFDEGYNSIPINAGVSDPFDYTTYANSHTAYGAMEYYEYVIGKWNEIPDIEVYDKYGNRDSILYYVQQSQADDLAHGRIDRTTYNSQQYTEARLKAFVDYLKLEYWGWSNPAHDYDVLYTRNALYSRDTSVTNSYPFHITAEEKTYLDPSSDDVTNNRYVVIRLYCTPTDFHHYGEASEVSEAYYRWEGFLKIVWDYRDNYNQPIQKFESGPLYDSINTNYPGLTREAYKLNILPTSTSERNSEYSGFTPRKCLDDIYMVTDTFGIAITTGFTDGGVTNTRDSDWTSVHNPTVAGFLSTPAPYGQGTVEVPNYLVEINDGGLTWTQVNTSFTYASSRVWMHVNNLPADGEMYSLRFRAITSPAATSDRDLYDVINVYSCASTSSVSVELNGTTPMGTSYGYNSDGGNTKDSDYTTVNPIRGTYGCMIILPEAAADVSKTLQAQMIINSSTTESINDIRNTQNRNVWISQDFTNFDNVVEYNNWQADMNTISNLCEPMIYRATDYNWDNQGQITSTEQLIYVFIPYIRFANVKIDLSYQS